MIQKMLLIINVQEIFKLTLPEFASLIYSPKSCVLGKWFDEYVTIYSILKLYLDNHDIEIVIDSSKSAINKGKCRIIVTTIEPVQDEILNKYKKIEYDLFNSHLQVKTKLVKKSNTLSITVTK